ncbi:MAG: hypothetical protein HY791_32255 [Deltaproteobacteria bacterium]|nr:hypothetical protein [Deltaproteobacteria bacterium]
MARTIREDPEIGARLLGEVYAHSPDGFRIPDEERETIRVSGGSPVYGELTPGSVRLFAEHIGLGASDVFYDLGSGLGKVVLQVAMTIPIKRCIGVELSETRVRESRIALHRARKLGLVQAKRVAFRVEDVVESDFGDATVVYTCSTAFTLRFLGAMAKRVARAPRLRCFASFREIDVGSLVKTKTLRLDASWCRGVRLHLYRRRED